MHVGEPVSESSKAWPGGVRVGAREWVCMIDLDRQSLADPKAEDTYKVVYRTDDRSLDVPDELR
jgi:hypothetical protein